MNSDLVKKYLPRIQEASVRDIPVTVGFDGFVDEIIHLVATRSDQNHFQRIPDLTAFGNRVLAAAGKSANIEMVPVQIKIGGNGPIMANALGANQVDLSYVGALGSPAVHPVFAELEERATVFNIIEPGHTDALEFEDGKLLMGKYAHLKDLDWEFIEESMGGDRFFELINRSKLVAMVNWTMCPGLSDIWRHLLERFEAAPSVERSIFFFDLADPEKRTQEDIREALDLICGFEKYHDVILGLNEKEAEEIAEVVGCEVPSGSDHERVGRLTLLLQRAIGVGTVVVHPRAFAAAASAGDEAAAVVDGPFTANPKISTGAGDHFNAGFCMGKLIGLPNEGALLTGVATSGFYVRTAHSPSLKELAERMQRVANGQDY
jgi:fructose-1-phosphate kinase PfkB-like protein